MARNAGKQSAGVAEQTRAMILAAASRQFASYGYKGASLREIAMEAEATHGLIRHHFGSKEDLWQAVMDHFITKVELEHQPLLATIAQREPIELLKGFAANYVRVSAKYPSVSKIIMNDCSEAGPHLDYVVERLLPVHKAIEPIFHAAQEAGYLQAHDPDSFFVFLVTIGSFPFALAPLTNKFYQRDICSEEGIEKHVELIIQTLFDD